MTPIATVTPAHLLPVDNCATGRPYGFVYLITNKINGKPYVGQTIRLIHKRWRGHCSKARVAKPRTVISRAIKKYGPDSFTIDCLGTAVDRESLNLMEELNIVAFDSIWPNGYNVTKTAQWSPGRGQADYIGRNRKPLSADHRSSISKQLLGKSKSAEHKAKISASKIGKSSPWSGGSHRKLTDDQAAAILYDPRPNKAIAADYNVSVSTISGIKNGRLYDRLASAINSTVVAVEV